AVAVPLGPEGDREPIRRPDRLDIGPESMGEVYHPAAVRLHGENLQVVADVAAEGDPGSVGGPGGGEVRLDAVGEVLRRVAVGDPDVRVAGAEAGEGDLVP